MKLWRPLVSSGLTFILGCGGSSSGGDTPGLGAAGGESATSAGGSAQAGGASAAHGGMMSAGGASGGSTSTGGATTAGGSPGAGGSTASGGSHSPGGASSTGGSTSTGGAPSTGGFAGAHGGDGSGGQSGGCLKDSDCPSPPPTAPAMCATAKCSQGACSFVTVDGDGDGHPTNKCKAGNGATIVLGDDCDDHDPDTYFGAWDGPKGDGHPDRCDAIDQSCDGDADDARLADGTSCTCTPDDVRSCSQDSGGKPITWPAGAPTGVCKYGSQTCSKDATWGPCTDAVPPGIEVCNGADDDCNGIADDGPPPDGVPADAPYWAYDGDNDLHARIPGDGYDVVRSCKHPTTAPVACTSGSLAGCTLGNNASDCCPPSRWKLAASIFPDDCNDENPKSNPVAPELCATPLDDNCDGSINEDCVCQKGEVDAQCAEMNGVEITFPGGLPQGTCRYGSRTCSSDGKSWSPCVGAVAPAAIDNCAFANNDDSCDGIPNEGCACNLGDQQDCGSNVGSCLFGKQSCDATGHYTGACVGGVVAQANDTCASGNDDSCNGIPNEACGCIDGTPCGAAATCNAGVWNNCHPNASGTCSGGPPTQPIVFSYDGDSDGYCDLSKTQSVCGNAPSQPAAPWKPLSSCTSSSKSDCDDTDGNKHPLAPEPCDGVDYNCDGNPNLTCSCTVGQMGPCWTGGNVVFHSAFAPSICQEGVSTCDMTGHYGTCTNQIFPLTETCNGKDDDCNGTADDGIAPNGACSVGLGECMQVGSKPCIGGAFTGCNVDAKPPVTTPQTTAGPNGTCDWNCDGTGTMVAQSTGKALQPGGDGCAVGPGPAAAICAARGPNLCTKAQPDYVYCALASDKTAALGTAVKRILCSYDPTTTTCNLIGFAAASPTDVVACK